MSRYAGLKTVLRGVRAGLSRRATAAVEFALIGVFAVTFLVGIGEVFFYSFVQVTLDYAVSHAARQLLTGQARQGSVTLSSFSSGTLCPQLRPLLNCNDFYVNIYPVANYAGLNSPVSNGSVNTAGLQFNPGSAGDLMVFQVIYLAPNMLWPIFPSSAGGTTVPITSTAAYRNES